MKYKLIYFFSVCICFVLSAFLLLIPESRTTWIHQHLQYKEKTVLQTEEPNSFSSHLPIVEINTGGQNIPGLSKEKDLITTDLHIHDDENTRNLLSDKPTLSVSANIKYRGNSSLLFDKKPYLLKFVDEDGNERKEDVMGMPAHDTWILNGPFLDKTLMRNYLIMNVSAEIMGYAPRVRYCELFLDGAYQGVYLMMESISIGDNRIDITPYKKGDLAFSYIVRADRGDEPLNEMNNFTKYAMYRPVGTDGRSFEITIEYPSKANLTPSLKELIEQDFSRFEKALYSYDYKDKTYGYRSFIHTSSFVDYFIINEFFQNYDAGIYSTCMYKDVTGKIHIGPVWDFNNAADNYAEISFDGTEFALQYRTWYYMLTKDEAFTEEIIQRYRELRGTYLSEEYLLNYIDEVQAFLGKAIDRNYEVWGYTFDPANVTADNKLIPDERNFSSYEESVEHLKNFLIQRGNWMDKNIETLRQFSHESKIKKY